MTCEVCPVANSSTGNLLRIWPGCFHQLISKELSMSEYRHENGVCVVVLGDSEISRLKNDLESRDATPFRLWLPARPTKTRRTGHVEIHTAGQFFRILAGDQRLVLFITPHIIISNTLLIKATLGEESIRVHELASLHELSSPVGTGHKRQAREIPSSPQTMCRFPMKKVPSSSTCNGSCPPGLCLSIM
jgi:hypothetical protein